MSFLKVHLLLTFLKVIYILQTDIWINKTMFAKPNSTIVIVVVMLVLLFTMWATVSKKQTRKLRMFQGSSNQLPTPYSSLLYHMRCDLLPTWNGRGGWRDMQDRTEWAADARVVLYVTLRCPVLHTDPFACLHLFSLILVRKGCEVSHENHLFPVFVSLTEFSTPSTCSYLSVSKEFLI